MKQHECNNSSWYFINDHGNVSKLEEEELEKGFYLRCQKNKPIVVRSDKLEIDVKKKIAALEVLEKYKDLTKREFINNFSKIKKDAKLN